MLGKPPPIFLLGNPRSANAPANVNNFLCCPQDLCNPPARTSLPAVAFLHTVCTDGAKAKEAAMRAAGFWFLDTEQGGLACKATSPTEAA